MRKRTARFQTQTMHGEPELDALLADPVMRVLWRADHIDPTEARKLFAETTERLHRRDSGPGQNEEFRADRAGGFSFAMN